jgi:hypothetical protein
MDGAFFTGWVILGFIVLFFLFFAFVARWIFRIDDIVKRLDLIIERLGRIQ